jgi:hypothetical protein
LNSCRACASLIKAGNVMADAAGQLIDDHGDVSIERMLQVNNAIMYWSICRQEATNIQQVTTNEKEPTNG